MNATISMTNKLRGAVTMANSKINGGASPYPKGASGDIITITDGADNTPLKSCVVNIDPVQDLHGYDYPWPAGGGKNILLYPYSDSSKTVNDIAFTVNNDGTINVNGTASERAVFYLERNDNNFSPAAGTYYISKGVATSNVIIIVEAYNGTSWVKNLASVVTDASIQFAIDYDGYDNVVVYMSVSSGKSPSNELIKPMIRLASETDATFAPYSNICPISGWSEVKVWVKPTYDTTLTPTATIPLGRTVYGGTLDALAGKMVVDRAMITMDGTQSIRTNGITSITSRFVYAIPGKANGQHNILSNIFSDTSAKDDYVGKFAGRPNSSNVEFYLPVSVAQTSAAGKQWFADNPTQVVYELATPQEYDLDPVTIKTLLGTNNIWADAGEMSIEYYPAAASIVAVQNRSTKAYVSIPLGMIRYETYQITPQQTIDLDSYRSENGNLLRNPVATKCKLEFNTPLMTDTQWAEIWNIIKAGFNNNTERKLKLKYYDTLSASYKTGYFYVPDVQTTIRNIDEATGTINYNEIRLAFIEY